MFTLARIIIFSMPGDKIETDCNFQLKIVQMENRVERKRCLKSNFLFTRDENYKKCETLHRTGLNLPFEFHISCSMMIR